MTAAGTPGAGDRRLQGSDPYPWPYDGNLDGPSMALLVVGAQPAWADRSLAVAEVLSTIDRVAGAVRARGGSVIATRHAAATAKQHRTGLPPAAGGPGWGLCPLPFAVDLVVDAAGVDGFAGSALDGELRRRGLDHLVLVGLGAEAPVDSTLRSANDRGYECLVVADAVAPFGTSTGAAALSSVTKSGGIFGAVATGDALIAALSSDRSLSPPLEVL